MIYYRKRIHQNLVSRFTLGEPAMANPPLRFCLNWSLLLPSPSSAGGGDGGRPGGCTQGSPSLFTGALMNLASFLWDRAHQGFSRLQAPNHHRRRHRKIGLLNSLTSKSLRSSFNFMLISLMSYILLIQCYKLTFHSCSCIIQCQ